MLDELVRLPHQKMIEGNAYFGRRMLRMADFSRLRTRCGFIALMPQWDFLDFLAGRARKLPGFRLRMGTEVTGLLFDGERVAGVGAETREGPLEVRAKLVVGETTVVEKVENDEREISAGNKHSSALRW